MFQIRFGKSNSLLAVRCALVGMLLLTCQPFLWSQNSAPATNALPKITIPKLISTINIDGDLKEPVWERSVVISCFTPNDGGHANHAPTALRLWYNDTALFLGWHCQDQDIQATLTNRDDHLWNEDVVEFFVAPHQLSRYFEFEWNPLGTIFDAIVTNRCDEYGASQGYQFNSSFTAAHSKSLAKVKGTVSNPTDKDADWQVEAMILFADLNQPSPKPGDVWRANFFRINRGTSQPAETSSWSPTRLPSLHHPARFGYIEFGK